MIRGFIRSVCGADGLSIIVHHMAEDERKRSSSRGISDRTVYEPRVATRRIESALLALGIITVLGVLGYIVFEGWSFADALYMTVITLTTVGYREVRPLDTTGQLWTMALLITGVGTLFYAAVSSVELVVEGDNTGYFGRRSTKMGSNRSGSPSSRDDHHDSPGDMAASYEEFPHCPARLWEFFILLRCYVGSGQRLRGRENTSKDLWLSVHWRDCSI